MKVFEQDSIADVRPLHTVRPGDVVKFEKKFYHDEPHHSVYIVCHASDYYMPNDCKYDEKIPVVNLRAGNLSYVQGDRMVTVYEAETRIARARG